MCCYVHTSMISLAFITISVGKRNGKKGRAGQIKRISSYYFWCVFIFMRCLYICTDILDRSMYRIVID